MKAMRAPLMQLIRLLAWMPPATTRVLADLAGRLLFRLPNRERRNAEINIGLCYPELSPEQRAQLLRSSLAHAALSFAEMPAIWLRGPERWLERIGEIRNAELPESLLTLGKGLIIAAPHLGAWEIGIHQIARLGPMTVLYRPPRQNDLEPLMLAGRGRSGARFVPTDGGGIRNLYQALKLGEIVTVLPDQQPKQRRRGAGVFAPFFGIPALTMTLISRLARKTGAPVVFVFVERLAQGQGFRIHWLPAPPGIEDPDPQTAATALNRGVENCVRQCPAQYQWSYKRFDAQPDSGPSLYDNGS